MSDDIALSETKTAKLVALEIVVIALMRQHRENPAFWDQVERIAALFNDLHQMKGAGSAPRIADLIQDELDLWRSIAGQDGSSPGDLSSLVPGLQL